MRYTIRGEAVQGFESWFETRDGRVTESPWQFKGWLMSDVVIWCRQHRTRLFVASADGAPRVQVHVPNHKLRRIK